MDVVRRRILALVKTADISLAEASRAIGRNHAYLQQFVRRGTPKALPEDVRQALAEFFEVEESEFRAPPEETDRRRASGKPSGPDRRVPRTFAARLSVARAESVFETPKRFAEAAGIDRDRYADLEEGLDSPSLDELDRVSRCSGKTLDWLIRGEMPQHLREEPAASPFAGAEAVFDKVSAAGRRRKKRATPVD